MKTKTDDKSGDEAATEAESSDAIMHRFLFAAFGLVALVLIVYSPSVKAQKIWDDDQYLFNNPMIRDVGGLGSIWLTTKAPDYFPVTWTFLWMEYRLWGDTVPFYHVVNLLLHALGCVMLWQVLKRLAIPGAYLAAMIFAVHPLNASTAVWIFEAKNTLSLPLMLGSILAYIAYMDGDKRRYRLALGLFVLAALAKTSVLALPAMLVLLTWWRGRKLGRSDALRLAPFFAVALGLGLLTVYLQVYRPTPDGVPIVPLDAAARIALMGKTTLFYLGKMFLPVDLIMIYPRWEIDTGAMLTYLPTALVTAAMATLWLLRKTKARPVLFAMAYFLVAAFPILGAFSTSYSRFSYVADHWMYVPMIGIITLAAGAAWHYAKKLPAMRGHAAMGIIGVVVAGLGLLSFLQQGRYKNMMSLWSSVLEKNPDCWVAHEYMGTMELANGQIELQQAGKPKEAMLHQKTAQVHFESGLRHFQEEVRLIPMHADSHSNLSVALVAMRRFKDAAAEAEKALQLQADSFKGHYNLARALVQLDRPEEAKEHLLRAADLQPQDPRCYYELGLLMGKQGKHAQAAEYYAKACQMTQPGTPMRAQLDKSLEQAQRLAKPPAPTAH